MIKSQKYLTCEGRIPGAFITMVGGIHIPKIYQEAMQKPKPWVEPMLKKINVNKGKKCI